jgi:hypothetical protein
MGLEGLNKFNDTVHRSARYATNIPKSKQGPWGHADFPVGGYHVSRDSHFRLIFDSGPLGIYPGFGHGHADALSILLSVSNKPLIADTGTMHYNADPVIRSHFRKTQSHNTLMVNGKGQAEVLDAFKWASGYRIQWDDTIVRDEFRLFSGLLRTDPFVHKRMIIHFLEKGFIIRDRVQTDGTISIEGFFHFSPGVAVKASRKNKFIASLGDEVVEIISPESRLICAQNFRGSRDPMLGWYSRNYGEMVPTNCLRICHNGVGHLEFITTIKRPGISLEWPEEFINF